MPGWFCRNGSTGQLDPFADQAIQHQWQLDFFFFYYYSTTNTQQPNSSQLWIYIRLFHLLSPPTSLIIQLLGHFHTAVTAVMLCQKLLILFQLKNKTLKVFSPKTTLETLAYLFFVVHQKVALTSFKEDGDRFVLCESRNNRKCRLQSASTGRMW